MPTGPLDPEKMSDPKRKRGQTYQGANRKRKGDYENPLRDTGRRDTNEPESEEK